MGEDAVLGASCKSAALIWGLIDRACDVRKSEHFKNFNYNNFLYSNFFPFFYLRPAALLLSLIHINKQGGYFHEM